MCECVLTTITPHTLSAHLYLTHGNMIFLQMTTFIRERNAYRKHTTIIECTKTCSSEYILFFYYSINLSLDIPEPL